MQIRVRMHIYRISAFFKLTKVSKAASATDSIQEEIRLYIFQITTKAEKTKGPVIC